MVRNAIYWYNETETNDNRPILWLEMPYIGTRGEQLLRGFKKKLLRCLNVNVQIKTRITLGSPKLLSVLIIQTSIQFYIEVCGVAVVA